ncbi:MAG: PKD domain-containing protein [Bacteroidetes bacterium]|nr:PKD domain-containing protein [Bacteroidota bacterium]
MKKWIFLSLIIISGIIGNSDIFAQQVEMKPTEVKQPEAFMTTIPLSEMDLIPATGTSDWKNGVVPNKEYMPPNRGKSTLLEQSKLPDYALQQVYPDPAKSPEGINQNFDGIANTYGVAPPDTDGDVGPNHYVQMVNMGFQIFNKSGTSLYGPASLSTIWTNLPGPWVGNYGDPIVLYDELADRWLLSQFSLPNYPNGPWYMLIAVSQTSNPTGSYHLYVYSFTDFPDYPKFGVWPDGYYMSINRFASGTLNWAGTGAAAFERSEMLNGNAAAMVYFTTPSSGDPASFLPADFDGTPPPANTPNYFTYIDGWSGTDRLRTYEFDVDWVTTSNSTFTGPYDIVVTPFSYPNSVPQLGGTSLDNLASRLMFRLQYRNFGTYQTLVTNHSVNADGTGRAGVRWYELRNTGGGWFMYQQGTYAPPDGLYRWMGSAALNGNGDLAIGYSVSSSSMNPAIAYTGRYNADALGSMTIPEVTIHTGAGSQSGTSRWGDYSAMSVDPSDDETFWYTQEYSNGGNFAWRTRIASFMFDAAVLTANFMGSPTTIVAGNSVTFTDMSIAGPTSWNWDFPGGIPSSYVGQTPPPITYNFPGSYDVTLTVSDGTDTDIVTKPGYITVTECNYCDAYATNASEEWISNVSFNTINNPSVGGVGYEDFTSISTDVLVGSSHGVTITCDQTLTWTEYISVFFDWNQDCDFDDLGEEYDLGSITGPGPLGTTVNVPGNAALGKTRMRVMLRYSIPPGPCDIYTYGQVEDYSVVVKGPIDLELTAFLEGPYNASTNLMETTLNSSGYLPLIQPFNPSTPYYDNASPVWQYNGSEYAPGFFPSNVVDWVQVQCRDANSPANATSATTVATEACLLLEDGSIVAADGSSMLNFNFSIAQDLYVVVFHRNHLGIISNNPVTQVGGVYSYDFSSGQNQVYGGSNAHKQIEPGVWGMVAADGNANGLIQNTDETAVWKSDLGSSGYKGGDFDLNGLTQNTDETNLWKPNLGGGGQVPAKTSEPLFKSWVPK